MPSGERAPRYRLSDLLVDVGRRTVFRGSHDIRLSKLSFELLRTLIEAAPNVVSNDQLARAVWHGGYVAPETVTQRVKLLRDALSDNPLAPRYIAGLRGHGYRVLPEVTEVSAESEPVARRVLGYQEKSIAVLPFADLSERGNREYLAEGMAEEIIHRLSKTPGLRVTARASSFYFRGRNERISAIAKELGVTHILEGSVRQATERLRVSAALVRAQDGTQIWSETYDNELHDVFAMQEQIAGSVAAALQFTLAKSPLFASRGGTTHLEAYHWYLRGKSSLYENSRDSLETARRQLHEALLRDPNFALAASRLAQVALLMTNNNLLSPREGYGLTRLLAERALRIDPTCAEAHLWLGYVYRTLDWNWPAAGAAFERVLQEDAGNVDAMMFAATLYKTLGQWSSAEEALQRAALLDPLNTFVLYNLGDVLYLSRRFAEAEAVFRRLLASTPHFQWTRPRLAMTLLAEGKPKEALALMNHTENMGRVIPWPSVLWANGKTTEADRSLQDLMGAQPFPNAYYVAANLAYRNDADGALEWLERAYGERETALISDMTNEPFFENIRHDSRFCAFRRRMNL